MSATLRGSFRMTLSDIRRSKWRSMLTMLGVIVGIVAVVTVVGIGDGVKQQVTGTLYHYGKDLIIVRPGSVNSGSTISTSNTDVLFGMSDASSLTTNDVSTVTNTPGVQETTPLGIVPGTPNANGTTMPGAFVLGTSENAASILNQQIAEGGFWSSDDDNNNVAVIGQNVADKLFGEPAPLGNTFTLLGQTFIVRGVFTPWENVPFSPTASFNDAIFIPYQSAARLTQNNSGIYAILAKTGNPKDVNSVTAAITSHLTATHGGAQNFSVLGPNQSIDNSDQVVHLLSIWIWTIAIISLLIGGVGIMNTMLLSVTERTHEIGVRKAVGATSRQILNQFMLEATVLSLVGGAIGVVVSLGVIGIFYLTTDFQPVISWQAIVIATFVSLVIGIIFGTAPAFKAAQKDPIESLRHE
ncbi:MAG TPA: ABC transporter permease [Verrucomicrobiae bacterium]|nr:ABC transporter permease [Verrucomicrobiae bacterium]